MVRALERLIDRHGDGNYADYTLELTFPRNPNGSAEAFPELVQLHFHDTRGTAITMLAEAGASVPEIAAITGHSYLLEMYLPRTRHLVWPNWRTVDEPILQTVCKPALPKR